MSAVRTFVLPRAASVALTRVPFVLLRDLFRLRMRWSRDYEARDAVMVGDRAETDILGARQVGMTTILVLTGVTREQDLPDLPAEQRPDYVLPALTSAGLVTTPPTIRKVLMNAAQKSP